MILFLLPSPSRTPTLFTATPIAQHDFNPTGFFGSIKIVGQVDVKNHPIATTCKKWVSRQKKRKGHKVIPSSMVSLDEKKMPIMFHLNWMCRLPPLCIPLGWDAQTEHCP